MGRKFSILAKIKGLFKERSQPIWYKDCLTSLFIYMSELNMGPLNFSELKIDPGAFEVKRNGKPINLRRKEFQLLEFLARNKNRVVNRHTLLEYIWNYNTSAVTNTLEVHMSNLRRKIDGDYSNKIIQTIYGAGYKFCDGE